MTTATAKLLKKTGVPNHIKGYEYLGEAIELVCKDREQIHLITKSLYPSIAKKFKTTPSRVERAIRHSIETAFNNLDANTIYDLFGNTVNWNSGRVTNSHFIAALSDLIRGE